MKNLADLADMCPTMGDSDYGVGVGAEAGICLELELEPKPEISKIGGSGNPAFKL